MQKTNTFGIIFYLRKYKISNGKAPIYARITIDGKRTDIAIKRSIEIDNWNNSKGMCKGSRDEVKTLNNYLEEIRSRIVECYQTLKLKKVCITGEAIKNLFTGVGEKEYTLCTLIEYHNTELNHTLEWGTLKNYMTTQKYVKQFLKEKMKTSDLFLSQLNYKFLTDFEYFLLKHQPKDHHKPCSNNTV